LADNTKERTQAEAQFKKTQKQKEGAEAMAAYVAEAFFILICVTFQNVRDGADSLEHVSISKAASLQARPISRNPLRCSSVLARAAQRTLSRAY
jgi:hypothetical protein